MTPVRDPKKLKDTVFKHGRQSSSEGRNKLDHDNQYVNEDFYATYIDENIDYSNEDKNKLVQDHHVDDYLYVTYPYNDKNVDYVIYDEWDRNIKIVIF